MKNTLEIEILKKIERHLNFWLGVMIMFSVACVATAYFDLVRVGAVGHLYASLAPIIATVGLFLIGVFFIIRGEEHYFANILFMLKISLAVVLLGIMVFLTGGWLDSPFAGVMGLFVSCFVSMQSDQSVKSELRIFNIIVVVISMLMLIFPYFISDFSYNSFAIIQWSDERFVVYGRLAITLVLLLVTAWAAAIINRDLSILPRAAAATRTASNL